MSGPRTKFGEFLRHERVRDAAEGLLPAYRVRIHTTLLITEGET